jgi:hypothetical protein
MFVHAHIAKESPVCDPIQLLEKFVNPLVNQSDLLNDVIDWSIEVSARAMEGEIASVGEGGKREEGERQGEGNAVWDGEGEVEGGKGRERREEEVCLEVKVEADTTGTKEASRLVVPLRPKSTLGDLPEPQKIRRSIGVSAGGGGGRGGGGGNKRCPDRQGPPSSPSPLRSSGSQWSSVSKPTNSMTQSAPSGPRFSPEPRYIEPIVGRSSGEEHNKCIMMRSGPSGGPAMGPLMGSGPLGGPSGGSSMVQSAKTSSEMMQLRQQQLFFEVSKNVSNHRGFDPAKIQELERKEKESRLPKLLGK